MYEALHFNFLNYIANRLCETGHLNNWVKKKKPISTNGYILETNGYI